MFVIGIDLGNDYSQVCYYNFIDGQPESVNFNYEGTNLYAPTAVLKEKGKEGGWMAGDYAVSCSALGEGTLFTDLLDKARAKEPVTVGDVTAMPVDLLKVYLGYLIQSAKIAFGSDAPVDKVCVTIRDYNISALEIIDKAFTVLGFPSDKIIYSSYVESFVYYAISQSEDLVRNDNVLLDYGKEGLRYCRMASVVDRGKRIFMTEYKEMTDTLPYMTNMDKLEEALLNVVKEEFDKKVISTVYLTGEGFDGEFSCDRFVNFICNRRRVFAGGNLYVKGACYQAYESTESDKNRDRNKDILIACNERITTGIEMKICDRGVDKILRLIKPGINWYKAGCTYDFIIDEAKEIELFLSPIDSRDKKLLQIPLSDIPYRENKASRVTLELSFASDNRCHLKVIDRGFGEFVKSSKKVINEDILL